MLLPTSAGAFCREVTAPTPAGYDPSVRGCFSPAINTLTGGPSYELFWRNACAGYSLARSASSQVSLEDATRLASRAFSAWSGVVCPGGGPPSILAVNEGPVDCSSVAYNPNAGNQHVIIFRDDGWPHSDPSSTLGLTTLTVDTSSGEIYDADIEINSHDFTLLVDGAPMAAAGADAGPGGYDLLGILTHEAGHFLGLAHSDNPTAIMDAFYTPSEGPLTADDVAGICAIDDPSGAHSTNGGPIAAAACDPTPKNGFASDCVGTMAASLGVNPTMCATPSRCSASAGRPDPAGSGGALVAALGLAAAVARRRARRLVG